MGYQRKNGTGGEGGSVWLEALSMYQNLNHIHHHHNRKFLEFSNNYFLCLDVEIANMC